MYKDSEQMSGSVCCESCLACLTAYLTYLCFETYFDKVLHELVFLFFKHKSQIFFNLLELKEDICLH